jgi:hypothetical protein
MGEYWYNQPLRHNAVINEYIVDQEPVKATVDRKMINTYSKINK